MAKVVFSFFFVEKKPSQKIHVVISTAAGSALLPFRDVILIHLPECTPDGDVTKSSYVFLPGC